MNFKMMYLILLDSQQEIAYKKINKKLRMPLSMHNGNGEACKFPRT